MPSSLPSSNFLFPPAFSEETAEVGSAVFDFFFVVLVDVLGLFVLKPLARRPSAAGFFLDLFIPSPFPFDNVLVE